MAVSYMKLESHGNITNGLLKIVNRKQFDFFISKMKDCDVDIIITKKRKKRSNRQNAYYHGVVVAEIQQLLIDANGEWINKDTVHEFLKVQFNYKQLVNKNNGDIVNIPQSTTELTTLQFEEYLDKCRAFALEFFGCEISLPNEQKELAI